MTTEDVGEQRRSELAGEQTEPTPAEIDAVMAAARVLVAVSARSVVAVEHPVTLPQLRVLVMIASRGPQNLHSVAEGLGVHPSNATRACDKLVEARLLHRSDDPTDRRNLILRLTASGHQLVHTVMENRRAAIAAILTKMHVQHHSSLIEPLRAFTDAAGETPESQVWALGWTTTDPHSTPPEPQTMR
jgi:DNA-binding MarR family transcriptional regulator